MGGTKGLHYLRTPAFPAALIAALLAFALPITAQAHCEVGERTFASTITLDDPCVSDELSLPTIENFKNGDVPSAQELDVSGEYTKTITRNFGVSLEEKWVHLDIPSEGSHSGFDNLGTSFKYQFVRDAKRELAMSASLDADSPAPPWHSAFPMRQFGSGFATRLAQMLLKTKLSDPLSGFFMLRRDVVDRAAQRLSPQGFKILLDVLASSPSPHRIREIPFSFGPRLHGESKLDSAVVLEYLGLLVSKASGGLLSIRFLMFGLVGCSGVVVNLAVLGVLLAMLDLPKRKQLPSSPQ